EMIQTVSCVPVTIAASMNQELRSQKFLIRPSYLNLVSHSMRIVFSFLPTVMVPWRSRFQCYPCWVVVRTEADSLSVWLCHCVDGQEKTPRQNGNTQFHSFSLLRMDAARARPVQNAAAD